MLNTAAEMLLRNQILENPGYGYSRNGTLYVPTRKEILREVLIRANPLKIENWQSSLIVATNLCLLSSLAIFFVFYFSWPLMVAAFAYGLVVMASFANFWTHRYCVHKAYSFRHSLGRLICQNLVLKAVSEEIHVISHHVHHWAPERPGDPYNPLGGFLYCFLSDINHQNIRKDLSSNEYLSLRRMLEHTGQYINSYAQYQKWGTLSHPVRTIGHYILNWTFWFAAFYLAGGLPLVTALFGGAGIWTISYRTLNYRAHGGGKNRHVDNVDFNRNDLSINRPIPGILAGEWHNNHHLFPHSARCGFLPHQIDLPWYAIVFFYKLGFISSYNDHKNQFYKIYWNSRRMADVKSH